MLPLSLEARLTEEQYDRPVRDLVEKDEAELVGLLEKLTIFHDGPWTIAQRYKSQYPDEWWRNLETIFARRSTPGQVILRGHLDHMRRYWRAQHGSAKQNPDRQTPKGVPVRSAKSGGDAGTRSGEQSNVPGVEGHRAGG